MKPPEHPNTTQPHDITAIVTKILADHHSTNNIANNIKQTQQHTQIIADLQTKLDQQELQWRQQLDITQAKLAYQSDLNKELSISNKQKEDLNQRNQQLIKDQHLLLAQTKQTNNNIRTQLDELTANISNTTTQAIREHQTHIDTIHRQQLAKYEGDITNMIRQQITQLRDKAITSTKQAINQAATDIQQRLIQDLDAYPAMATDELQLWWEKHKTTHFPTYQQTIQNHINNALGTKQDPNTILGQTSRRLQGLVGSTISSAQLDIRTYITHQLKDEITKQVVWRLETKPTTTLTTKLQPSSPQPPSPPSITNNTKTYSLPTIR